MTALALEFDSTRLQQAMLAARNQLEKALDRVISRGVLTMARTAKREAPKAHSTLTNAIHSEHPSPLEGRVVAGVNYGQYAADDTDPQGVPPEQSILDWIQVKGIEPDDPTMDEEDLAYVIARSIAVHGTSPNPYHERAFDQHKGELEKRMDQAVENVLEGI